MAQCNYFVGSIKYRGGGGRGNKKSYLFYMIYSEKIGKTIYCLLQIRNLSDQKLQL